MADIMHKLDVHAPRERVYRALVERDALAGWWTHDVRTEGSVGSVAEFRFGAGAPTKMRITRLEPSRRVVWRCIEGPREWIGTDVSFSVTSEGDITCVRFTQCGWAVTDDFFAHCNFYWANLLANLRAFVEGEARRAKSERRTDEHVGVRDCGALVKAPQKG